jgi:preprotein translocase subunit SecD
VTFTFTPDGTEAFARLTERHRKRRIAFVLDDLVLFAPIVQTRIVGGSGVLTVGGGPADEQRLKATTLAAA